MRHPEIEGTTMTKLLHISASPRGAQSDSLAIAESFLAAYRENNPDRQVDTLDLWDNDMPDFGPTAARAKMTALAGEELIGEEAAVWKSTVATFERFAGYDHYLFSVPMWNHGVPYVLKHFIDIVSQKDFLFTLTPEEGYKGLLTDKKAAVVYTSAVYSPTSGREYGIDFQESYFDYWLDFCGITDVTKITLRQNLLSPEIETTRQAALEQAAAAGRDF
ncbi:FMN-dependent NADH-azoreductase [Nonomuraea polychroma]|uniref:FMN-dependent NADH-azoreductase n=1 Tax=Nonomuraea polychroma TaxID=46176 RepID=UPI003D8A93DC